MAPHTSPLQQHRDELEWPWAPPLRQQGRRRNHRQQQQQQQQQRQRDYAQLARYGVGIAAGIHVVGWLKRRLQRLPVVGLLATPFLCLMPTVLLGGAVGAAVVYGIEEGDPLAAQKKALPAVQKQLQAAQREVAAVAADISHGVRAAHRQHLAAAEAAAREGEELAARLASSLDAAAREAEATLVPAVERHVAAAERQLQAAARRRQLQQQLEEAWPA